MTRAFDTIDHDILLKYETIGFAIHTIDWLKLPFKSNFQSKFRKVLLESFQYYICFTRRIHFGTFTITHIREWHTPNCKIKSESCLVFRENDNKETEKKLNLYFKSICEWFVDKPL